MSAITHLTGFKRVREEDTATSRAVRSRANELDLPHDVIASILLFADILSIARSRQVSRNWKIAVFSNMTLVKTYFTALATQRILTVDNFNLRGCLRTDQIQPFIMPHIDLKIVFRHFLQSMGTETSLLNNIFLKALEIGPEFAREIAEFANEDDKKVAKSIIDHELTPFSILILPRLLLDLVNESAENPYHYAEKITKTLQLLPRFDPDVAKILLEQVLLLPSPVYASSRQDQAICRVAILSNCPQKLPEFQKENLKLALKAALEIDYLPAKIELLNKIALAALHYDLTISHSILMILRENSSLEDHTFSIFQLEVKLGLLEDAANHLKQLKDPKNILKASLELAEAYVYKNKAFADQYLLMAKENYERIKEDYGAEYWFFEIIGLDFGIDPKRAKDSLSEVKDKIPPFVVHILAVSCFKYGFFQEALEFFQLIPREMQLDTLKTLLENIKI